MFCNRCNKTHHLTSRCPHCGEIESEKSMLNKDHIDGVEMLIKRIERKIPYMTYKQIQDEGGVLGLVHKEYIKMVDEWSDEMLVSA